MPQFTNRHGAAVRTQRLLRSDSHPAAGSFQIDGRVVPPAEVYPRSEQWGVDGFTFTDRDAAFAKLRELV